MRCVSPARRTGQLSLQGLLVGGADHSGVSHDHHVVEVVGVHEVVDHRDHGGGLGLVALEGPGP